MKTTIGILLLCPALAMANPYKERLTDAAEGLEDAQSAARRSGARCDSAMSSSLERAIDDIDEVRRGASERRFGEIQRAVNDLALAAPNNGCSQKVSDRIARAVVHLNAARAWLEDHGDRRERRQRRDDDDEDDRARPPPPGQQGLLTVGALRVTYNQMMDNEQAVRVDVTSVQVTGRPPPRFLLGARVRPQNGPPGPWEMVRAPFRIDALAPNADLTTFWFKVRQLPGAATAGGRFVVQVAVFDENRVELGSREAPLEFAVAPPPPPVARDCGTPADAGCEMQRGGHWAMDRDTFNGLLQSLRGNSSDLTKADMCRAVLGNNWITAKQLGLVLDFFSSDLIRLDVAKVAAPHTVNPQHALGLSSKFRSSLLQADFTRLMADQR